MARVLAPKLFLLTLPVLASFAFVAPAQQAPGTPPAANPAPAATPIDQALAWLTEARRNYTAVKDYSATLAKRERIRGVLHDENVIMLTSKTQPFSIYMKWLAPAKSRNQEVCYVQGRNN